VIKTAILSYNFFFAGIRTRDPQWTQKSLVGDASLLSVKVNWNFDILRRLRFRDWNFVRRRKLAFHKTESSQFAFIAFIIS